MATKRYPACIMATCCVPWDERGQFAEAIFRREVRNMLQGTRHLYVFGTAGEGYAVTERQFDQVVDTFAEEMRRGGAEPIVGVVSPSLSTIIERIERCRARGVTRFQISLPNWGALNDRELAAFFKDTCGRFPDCQFLHYNLMRTKRLVQPLEYAKLAADHPNLVATKNSSDSFSFTLDLLHLAGDLRHFLTETGYLYGSLFDECGLLASLVTSWEKLHQVFEAGRKRQIEVWVALEREMRTILKELFACVGDSAHIDGAYDKMFARVIDGDFPLRLLPPYSSVSEDRFQRFADFLAREMPDWLPGPRS